MSGTVKNPKEYGLSGYSEITLTTSDGTKVSAWSHEPVADKPVIVFFHGNGGTLPGRIQRYQAFINEGYGLFVLSYRGYGHSEGSPTEAGIFNDARASMAWVNQHYPRHRIILYGESLGTGVAVEMASEQQVSSVVLQSPYTSVANVAASRFWFLPFAHSLVSDPFDSFSKISAIHTPILMLHGDKDTTIPIAQGRELFEKANEPKRFITVQGAGHMNIPDETVLSAMRDFPLQ